MNREQLSKTLSWLLRHGAGEAGVTMDAAGWVAVDAVLAHLGIARGALEDAVTTNTKSRLQLEGARIRACQGHSTDNMPVTCEALEASWRRVTPEGSLWHGTTVEATAGIAREGLRPQRRTHVHLAASTDSRVGKRAATPVLLEVSSAALARADVPVYEAQNGVLLVRRVPVESIVGAVCTTRAARAAEAQVRARFGWDR